ncbi:uncharacterized protein LOC125948425 isoform X11 [Anopheles darlingi]|uniref:uncharacterized protein LOC125948425 isoform X9 n=1 Tax=Anopheles darlingi TaxID=43151 RepID=UPI0021002783|nr:uncharacterized protein LOC125948425 isoform X9 [Anopheles darlingi]XP_049530396.1 uncharacterized protein LOC125948425 isoform X10 [Anopheles darlingi]XP_049530397.1 uncharacterized protein LOC125948425 isoform X11 [Anopheles darlingi]XP_049530398.1 uncharacterized protein LOC125948425 isoform X12 [Anopheles darlingi]XP_049530399.1 uncharacterized protein LOC125948425 isoform X12 [Anopheles darlingi]XP_049530400.1 uncharacterized protein LOC125948425 isoform X11 [Anopheles darlingi]
MDAIPSNFQIGCTEIEVVTMPPDQEGRNQQSAHPTLPSAVSLSVTTNSSSDKNESSENESVSKGEQLLIDVDRKLDLVLKKLNRLQRRVTVIEKNMKIFENQKKACAPKKEQVRKERPMPEVPETSKNSPSVPDKLVLPFTPVSCLFELEKLEEKAKDMHFVNYVKMQVNRIVGLDVEEGKGYSYCWRILDLFFTRFFMTQCTWSGRLNKKPSDGVSKKIRFKDFNYMINLIHQAANYADPLFSRENAETVLKLAFKRAIRRFQCSVPQTPTIPDGAIVTPIEEISPNIKMIGSVESYEIMEFDPLEIKTELEI